MLLSEVDPSWAGVASQQVNLLPIIHTFHKMEHTYSPSFSISDPAYFFCTWNSPILYLIIAWLLHPVPWERPGLNFWLLALVWPRPGCCGHVGNESFGGRFSGNGHQGTVLEPCSLTSEILLRSDGSD